MSAQPLRSSAGRFLGVALVLFVAGALHAETEAPEASATDEASSEEIASGGGDEAANSEEPVELATPTGNAVTAGQTGHVGLEEITVRAQKRATRLQDTPIAISVLTGTDLSLGGIEGLESVAFQVPNFHYGELLGNARITIRGVSQSGFGDPATTVHIDGVYQNAGTLPSELNFFDIEQVEVLRGPQGTLYGRNATGGSINVRTRPPTHEVEAYGDVMFGNYSAIMTRAVLNLPLVDDALAWRAAFFQNKHDGYQRNLLDGRRSHDADDARDWGLRSQLLFEPTEDLRVTLRGQYARLLGVGWANKLEGELPENTPLRNFRINSYVGARPNPSDPREIYRDTLAFEDGYIWSLNSTLDLDFHAVPFFGDANFTFVGSYAKADRTQRNEVDQSSIPLIRADTRAYSDEWVIDAHWKSRGDRRVDWLVGAFYLGGNTFVQIDLPTTLRNLKKPGEELVLPVLPIQFKGLVVNGVNQLDRTHLGSAAGYIHGSLDFDDERFTLSGGLRYSRDWKTGRSKDTEVWADLSAFLGPNASMLCLIPGYDDERSSSWDAWTGDLKLEMRPAEDHMVYVSGARGYKAGTIEHVLPLNCPDEPNQDFATVANAEPETIWAMEIGSKNRFFDDRLQANLTGFFYSYTQLQVSSLVESVTVTQNADSARIFGTELELVWLPTDELRLSASYGFLDARFTDFVGFLVEAPNVVVDMSGNKMPRAPDHSATLIGLYTFDLGRFGSLQPRAQFYVSDEVFFRGANLDSDRQPAYYKLDFRARWRSTDERIYLEGFVDNATDEDTVFTKAISTELLGRGILTTYDAPRTWGIRLGLQW